MIKGFFVAYSEFKVLLNFGPEVYDESRLYFMVILVLKVSTAKPDFSPSFSYGLSPFLAISNTERLRHRLNPRTK